MKLTFKKVIWSTAIALLFFFQTIRASDAIDKLQEVYQKQGATSFSAKSGELLWHKKFNNRSCTTCHSSSVRSEGQHKRTGKVILPMAPSVNSKRLTNQKKVKKWFLRNCKWTFGRVCSAQEKGDILQWLKEQ
ncbi:MAG: cytochrome C [Gammaproteobacteria bacterium]|nr:MAG: cytochrome C [Gammaproteobacteria bacterium]RLA19874.1 MAG: cytochrome C [Gammaproteobacteria bacterium]